MLKRHATSRPNVLLSGLLEQVLAGCLSVDSVNRS